MILRLVLLVAVLAPGLRAQDPANVHALGRLWRTPRIGEIRSLARRLEDRPVDPRLLLWFVDVVEREVPELPEDFHERWQTVRRIALEALAPVRMPWVHEHVMRACGNEHLDVACRTTTTRDRIRRLMLRRTKARSSAFIDPQLYLFAEHRSPGTRFLPLESARRGLEAEGLERVEDRRGWWSWTGDRLPVRLLGVRPGRLVLLGYRLRGEKPQRLGLLHGEERLGEIELVPGLDRVLGDMRLAAFRLGQPLPADGVVELCRASSDRTPIELHAFVRIDVDDEESALAASLVDVVRVRPGRGARLQGTRVRRLRIERSAVVHFEVEAKEPGEVELVIAHYTDSGDTAVYDLELDGARIGRLMSQPLPRPWRGKARVKAGPNRLEFKRVSGRGMYLDTIRCER